MDLVLYHHNHTKSNYPDLCSILKKADHHSASEREDIDDTQEVNKTPLISLFSTIKSSTILSKISKFGQYKDKILNKEYEYLSIVPTNTSKSNALDILGKYLSISNDEIMAIGDNLNDVDMVKKSGVGVAVANAYSELKDVAKYVTHNDVSAGGFAEAVYKFITFDNK